MYRTAVMTVFLSALAIIAVDLAIRLVRRRPPQSGGQPAGSSLLRWLRVLVNLGGVLTLLVVAGTAFSALLTNENGFTGDRLIWHVGSAPAFALAAIAVTIFWAHKNRFVSGDGSRLTSAGSWALPLRKFFFWFAVALAIPTLLSILLAMFPVFGPDDQQNLFRVHRYCAPLLTAAGILFSYFAMVTWRQRSRD